MESHLHFSSGQRCGTFFFFHVFIGHLDASSEQHLFISVVHFLIGSFILGSLTALSSLHICDISSLFMSSWQIAFPFV